MFETRAQAKARDNNNYHSRTGSNNGGVGEQEEESEPNPDMIPLVHATSIDDPLNSANPPNQIVGAITINATEAQVQVTSTNEAEVCHEDS